MDGEHHLQHYHHQFPPKQLLSYDNCDYSSASGPHHHHICPPLRSAPPHQGALSRHYPNSRTISQLSPDHPYVDHPQYCSNLCGDGLCNPILNDQEQSLSSSSQTFNKSHCVGPLDRGSGKGFLSYSDPISIPDPYNIDDLDSQSTAVYPESGPNSLDFDSIIDTLGANVVSDPSDFSNDFEITHDDAADNTDIISASANSDNRPCFCDEPTNFLDQTMVSCGTNLDDENSGDDATEERAPQACSSPRYKLGRSVVNQMGCDAIDAGLVGSYSARYDDKGIYDADSEFGNYSLSQSYPPPHAAFSLMQAYMDPSNLRNRAANGVDKISGDSDSPQRALNMRKIDRLQNSRRLQFGGSGCATLYSMPPSEDLATESTLSPTASGASSLHHMPPHLHMAASLQQGDGGPRRLRTKHQNNARRHASSSRHDTGNRKIVVHVPPEASEFHNLPIYTPRGRSHTINSQSPVYSAHSASPRSNLSPKAAALALAVSPKAAALTADLTPCAVITNERYGESCVTHISIREPELTAAGLNAVSAINNNSTNTNNKKNRLLEDDGSAMIRSQSEAEAAASAAARKLRDSGGYTTNAAHKPGKRSSSQKRFYL